MKLLHTSDWHIGRSLYGRKRYEEFAAFLNWLADYIDSAAIDALLVSGDVFDNIAPSNRAQELYYRFLCRIAASPCRHMVVIGGNHDSPSFLNAPREVLRYLNVHIIGSVTEPIENEVIVLADGQGVAELIVCAVPYLRDRDVRKAEAGEGYEEKGRKLIEGIRSHYACVCGEAERIRLRLGREIPIIAMGHLFAAGGQTIDSDGVRDLYVGSLAHVGGDTFPACIDYLALGHLHIPQNVGGADHMRYSGSPLLMGFGEAGQEKTVCQVEFNKRQAVVTAVPIPAFQQLKTIKGGWEHICGCLGELKNLDVSVLIEVIYTGEQIMGDLRERLDELTDRTRLEILKIKNEGASRNTGINGIDEETLADLGTDEVFERCLDSHQIPPEQREDLIETYREAVWLLQTEGAGLEDEG